MSEPLHADELPIDLPLVRASWSTAPCLVIDPSRCPLRRTGSSNRLFRLGDELLVRLPRQRGGTATIERSPAGCRWWHRPLGRRPRGASRRRPGGGYPERWSVVRWLPGVTPSVREPGERGRDDRLARALAEGGRGPPGDTGAGGGDP
ncbi:MAG: hypothetical protein R2734_10150 [Nocardioides sp.]